MTLNVSILFLFLLLFFIPFKITINNSNNNYYCVLFCWFVDQIQSTAISRSILRDCKKL